jgi:hypothetical protein
MKPLELVPSYQLGSKVVLQKRKNVRQPGECTCFWMKPLGRVFGYICMHQSRSSGSVGGLLLKRGPNAFNCCHKPMALLDSGHLRLKRNRSPLRGNLSSETAATDTSGALQHTSEDGRLGSRATDMCVAKTQNPSAFRFLTSFLVIIFSPQIAYLYSCVQSL